MIPVSNPVSGLEVSRDDLSKAVGIVAGMIQKWNMLGGAVEQIMDKRIDAGRRYVRVLVKIKHGVEKRMRIASLTRSVLKVMACAVERRVAQVRMSLPVPDRVEKGRLAKDFDFFDQTLGRFGSLREKAS